MSVHPPIYLDNGATTRTDPRVLEAMTPFFLDTFGNASSLHRLGVKSREGVEAARRTIAGCIGADAEELVFTSGGTEADTLAVRGVAGVTRKRRVVMTSIEHPAVLSQRVFLEEAGFHVEVVPVERDGIVSAEAIASAVDDDTALVCVMMANNELGTIQPVDEIGPLVKRRNPDTLLFVDAVQAFTKVPIRVRAAQIDLLSLSSHKIHGPKGVGALYIRKGVRLSPLVSGGSQEGGTRPGTENVPGIVGFGCAAGLGCENLEADRVQMANARDRLVEACLTRLEPVSLNGDSRERLCNNANLNFHGARAELLLHMLEAEGLYVSSGAACHAGSKKVSYVLAAIGVDRDEGSLRLTLSRHTTDDEIDRAIAILERVVPEARAVSRTER